MSTMDPQRAFLGVGWAYPVCLDGGRIEVSVYEKDIREAIRIILLTNHGERLMRPEFGAGLNEFVFEPVNTATMEAVRTRVTDSLIDWEPRIDVESVRVTADGALQNVLLIDVHYRTRATNTHHNLVFPFYLQEGAALS